MSGPVDYLIIGHLTKDLTPEGPTLGGTAAYASLTARAHGLKVGVLTSFGVDLDVSPLQEVEIINRSAAQSTTFINIYEERGRTQVLKAKAERLSSKDIPDPWQTADIVHLAPIAAEVDLDLIDAFQGRFICMTPQGWLRQWNDDGVVFPANPEFLMNLMPEAELVVISEEDLPPGESIRSELASHCQRMILTSGSNAVRVYDHGVQSEYPTPIVPTVDATGAGDIFASALFIHFYYHRDLQRAVQHAIQIAAHSVTREGLAGCPTAAELNDFTPLPIQ